MKYAFLGSLVALSLAPTVGLSPFRPNEQTQASNAPIEKADSISPANETAVKPQPSEVIKVGEYQSATKPDLEQGVIATVQAHELNLRPAATLYVRNIPIVTFTAANSNNLADEGSLVKVSEQMTISTGTTSTKTINSGSVPDNPIQRASVLATQLNQLRSYAIDPTQITVRWDVAQERYIIGTEELDLIAMGTDTLLPDTTHDIAQDALQATNRLRRQFGNAPPLTEIANAPKPQPIAVRPVQQILNGIASWYGPGFHGNLTANGEVYDQREMTAAHPSLPFGTEVRVTNQNTGLSAIVRINDRGPYAGGRIIDLSAAAAYAVGMVNSGIAPVTVEILTPVQQ